MARNAVLPILTAEPGLTHYLEEIRRFPMLERQEEYLLAHRRREHSGRDLAHEAVTRHVRRVAPPAPHGAGTGEGGVGGSGQPGGVDKPRNRDPLPAGRGVSKSRRKTLSDALTVLNKRERRIFETRRLAEEQIALVELAEEFGVSRERVRQIEVSAFEKVQNAVKHRVAAMATPAPLQVR